jgi:hypothetical protein
MKNCRYFFFDTGVMIANRPEQVAVFPLPQSLRTGFLAADLSNPDAVDMIRLTFSTAVITIRGVKANVPGEKNTSLAEVLDQVVMEQPDKEGGQRITIRGDKDKTVEIVVF